MGRMRELGDQMAELLAHPTVGSGEEMRRLAAAWTAMVEEADRLSQEGEVTRLGPTYMTFDVFAEQFVTAFQVLALAIHGTAVDKGFWPSKRPAEREALRNLGLPERIIDQLLDRNDSEMLMLVVSELAEACEALRKRDASGALPRDDKLEQYLAVEVELADAIIRMMDLAAGRGWRIAEAVVAKFLYNRSRPYKHGKAF